MVTCSDGFLTAAAVNEKLSGCDTWMHRYWPQDNASP